MNLPGKYGHFQQPFFDGDGTQGRQFNNGKSYTLDDLQNGLFSGAQPYEASSRYSTELKETIRKCLEYQQSDRPTFATLKETTSKWAGKSQKSKLFQRALLRMVRSW